MRLLRLRRRDGVSVSVAVVDDAISQDAIYVPDLKWIEIHGVAVQQAETVFTVLAGRPRGRTHIAYRVYEVGSTTSARVEPRAAVPPALALQISESSDKLTVSVRVETKHLGGARSVVMILSEDCLARARFAKTTRSSRVTCDGPLMHVRTAGCGDSFNFSYVVPKQQPGPVSATALSHADGTLPIILYPTDVGGIDLSLEDVRSDVVTNADSVGPGQYCMPENRELAIILAPESCFRFDFVDGKAMSSIDPMRESAVFRDELERIIAFFQKLFGPSGHLTILMFPTRDVLAKSLPNLILVHPHLAKTPRNLLFRFLPHEVAHQWIGNGVRCVGDASLWLQEGLAEYLQFLYLRSRFGEPYFLEILGENHKLSACRTSSRDCHSIAVAQAAHTWHRVATAVGCSSFKRYLRAISEERVIAGVQELAGKGTAAGQ
jgi:hypothetical protein